MSESPKTSDYFAEMYVAGRFAEAGWNVYFPHRDNGFDFIVSKSDEAGSQLIRPVQVKGKYPTEAKKDWPEYGYQGRLSQVHEDMVLAIPFFSGIGSEKPEFVAYMPRSEIKPHSKGYRCKPATFKGGKPVPRRDYRIYIGVQGLKLVENTNWREMGRKSV